MNRRRQLLFELTDNPRSSRAASFYGFVIEFGSLLSSIMLVARTLDGAIHGGVNPQFPSLDEALFFQTDFLFTALFSFDFLLRLVVCPSLWHMNPSDEDPVQPFLRDFYNWFDFVSVLPFYIEQTLGESKAVPLLRMLRMLRILKMTRHFSGTAVLFKAIKQSHPPLKIASVFLGITGLFFGSLIYLLDPCRDKHNCPFPDVFNGMYFAFTTMTTVGYGDVVPTKDEVLPRSLTMLLMVIGSLFLAMPIVIIGTEFDRAWKSQGRVDQNKEKIESSENLRESVLKYTGANDLKPVKVPGGREFDCSTEILHRSKALANTTIEMVSRFDCVMVEYLRMSHEIGSATRDMGELVTGLRSEWIEASALQKTCVIAKRLREFEFHRAKIERALELVTDKPRWKSHDVFFRIFCAQRVARRFKLKAARTVTRSRLKLTRSPTTVIVAKGQNEIRTLIEKRIEKYQLHYNISDVLAAQNSDSIRDKIWLLLEVPVSSRLAAIVSKVLFWSLIASITVAVTETMPDFQRHGESSYFCKLAVQEYCSDISSTFVSDPGCFVHPIDDDNAPVPLRFDCKSNLTSDCYGAGLNFGSSTPGGYSCSTQPFRDATQLQDTGLYDICRRLQCDDNGVTYIDMADYWRYLEWYFALLFTLEQMAGFFVHRNKLVFFQDPIVLIDICTLVTFYYLELIAILNSTPVSYAIPPGSTDILTILQMLRIGRIYKLYRNMPNVHIVYAAINKAAKKLAVPYFLLGLSTVLLSFILYEVEKGVECFTGSDCYIRGQLVEYPAALDDAVANKRVSLNHFGQVSKFEDVFSCLWFSTAAITSVGYGDIVPVTQPGKFITVLAILVGACYTAMPLTVMGGEFRKMFMKQTSRLSLISYRIRAQQSLRLSYRHEMILSRFRLLKWGVYRDTDDLSAKLVRAQSQEEKTKLLERIDHILGKLRLYRQVTLRLGELIQNLRRHGTNLAFEYREGTDG